MAKNLIINNLLCFLRTAKDDYADEVLFDLLLSFYSSDEVKIAKELVADLLKKDITIRKNPGKKKKDLEDIIEYFNEFKDSTNHRKDIFVSDSYKRMPPLGLEFIAPILTNLSDEIIKINNLLPKITDIKSEVANTADTVRSMKVQISNLEKKIANSTSLSAHATPSTNARSNLPKPPLMPPLDHQKSPTQFLTKTPNNDLLSNAKSNKIVELQRNIFKDIQPKNVVQERNFIQDDNPSNDSQNIDCDDDSGWSVYHRKRRNYENRNNVKTENSRRSLIIGSKKNHGKFIEGNHQDG